MGIDYVLDLACTPKKHLNGVENLVGLVKAKNRAETILEMLRREGDKRQPHEISFEMMLQTPDGTETEEVTVAELLEQAKALEPERGHCAGCPANGDSPGFGCYKSIPYPIPTEAETWLLGLLPDELDSTAGRLLLQAIEDFDWDGDHAAGMREEGDTFFQSRLPQAVSWGEGDDEVEVDSNQLFHILFHVGNVGAMHAFMVCLFLGVVPHDLELEALADPARRASALVTATVPQPPSEACEPMATFLHALVTAARLDIDVLIDG
jgi:hypothetical protein